MRHHWKSLIASLISFCAVTVFLLSLCPSCQGQTSDATLGGVVEDRSGAVIPHVTVKVTSVGTGLTRNATTNDSGLFNVPGLNPGRYSVHVEHPGFADVEVTDITLNVGSNRQLEIKLPIGQSSQSITVDGSGLQINTTDASVSTVVDRKFVENMPLNGRSFQDLISMTPGVTTQSPQASSTVGYSGDFSVNGQRTESNYYMVDGLAGNVGAGNGYGTGQPGSGGAIAAGTALGTTQSLISVDALQEFRVESSSYSAEYGHSPGGQFSLATRSGTNKLHGSAFDYIRNDFFDANDWFNDHYGKSIPALRQNDFGGTVGGPIRFPGLYDGRGRTFFFVSYEGLRLRQPQAASIQYVPDTFMREQAPPALQSILNAYPVQNGIDYGTVTAPSLAQFIAPSSLPSDINATSVRIDHSITSAHRIFFRASDTPSSTVTRSLSTTTRSQLGTTTYMVGASSQLSATATNEFRLGYSASTSRVAGQLDDFGGATPIDLVAAMGSGSLPTAQPVMYLYFPAIGPSQLSLPDSSNMLHQWNVNDIFTLLAGRHTLKFGFDYRRLRSSLAPSSPLIEGIFETPQSVLTNQANTLYISKTIATVPIFNDSAAFLQDEWRVNSRLNVSIGLRYEVAPPPSEAHGNDAYTLEGDLADPASVRLAPQGTPLWRTGWYNFAPRFGVAWTTQGRSGWETIVRSGGGVFFDSANQVATQGYSGVGFGAYNLYSRAPVPATAAQLDFAPSATAPYVSSTVYAFPPHLQLPYTLQWNTSLEQALGRSESLTLSYVGANGRRLLSEQQTSLLSLNSNFGTIEYFLNNLTSNYQALEAKFQRSVTHGLQALASYTWAHSVDYGSSSAALPVMRGNSDFDVRNNFQIGASWDLPASSNRIVGTFLNDWGLDARGMSRTAFPVTLNGNFLTDPATGTQYYGNLNLVANEPLYLRGSQYPGGRIINASAFSLPANNVGDAPRNFVRGFGATQVNIAARRNFHIRDAVALQFRAETFNILNHPNFGYIDPTYGDITFGQATQMLNQSLGTVAAQYQQGGPRSMQFALKLTF